MQEKKEKPRRKSKGKILLFAVIIFIIIMRFFIRAYVIPSNSMIPALEPSDRIAAAVFWNWFFEPSRGSLYVFKSPMDRDRNLLKRVIAVPGDTVDIKDGTVIINGQPTEEPYVQHHDRYTLRPSNIFPQVPFTVPEGKYFLLGDNRSNSQDSRYWGFVSIEDMIGSVFFRYWPPERIGIPK